MDLVMRRLLAQAHLFDDPSAYEAGVRDALDVLQAEFADEPAPASVVGDRDRMAV